MPVLVTGASGFLGGRLAALLVEQGESVTVLAREKARLDHLAPHCVRVVRGSLTDLAALQQAAADATEIYHCAAASTDWATKTVYQESNVDGTQALLDVAIRMPGLRRFLHVSTTDVYGYPVRPRTEEEPLVDAGLPYNQTKRLAEMAVWQAAREHSLPVTIVRPATIYGPARDGFRH